VTITKGTNYVTITPQQYVTIAQDKNVQTVIRRCGLWHCTTAAKKNPKHHSPLLDWKTKTELRRTTISTYTCSLTELTNSFDRPTGGLHVDAPSITPSFGGAHLTPSIGELQPPTVAVAMRKPGSVRGLYPQPEPGVLSALLTALVTVSTLRL